MKKSKKKVASTMDERAQLISGESAARGYWVAMLGMFVTIMVASKTHSLELAQSLLFITFFGSMCVVVVHSVSRNGHPWLLDKKIEKRVFVFSWVMLLGGAFVSLMYLLILVQSFRLGKNPMASVTSLTMSLTVCYEGWVIINRIKKNRLEELEDLKMKSARVAKDLTQQGLADAIGVSRQTISAIEKGDYNPTINLCIAICKTLDKTLDQLFWESED